MKYLRMFWCGAALATALAAAFAQEAGPRVQGTVLLLVNDRVLEGEVVRVDDQYRIRRGSSETVVSTERVKRVCADWDDALAYLRAQANLRDADERLRLARWCHLHGLAQHALTEAQAALNMRPGHAESKQLLEVLRRQQLEVGPRGANVPPALAAAPPVALGKPAVPGPAAPPATAPALDLSADSLTLFTSKVQPILFNLCARCHIGEECGAFRLHRAFDGGQRVATQRNLAAAVAQLNLDRPAASRWPPTIRTCASRASQRRRRSAPGRQPSPSPPPPRQRRALRERK
jgi:hypothetical protein